MTEKEYKKELLELGLTEEQISKIDFDKVNAIINQAKNMDELCDLLIKNYPDFNVAAFKKAVKEAEAANNKSSDEVEDLSDDSLEAVAGGSVGSWLKENGLSTLMMVGIVGATIGSMYLIDKMMAPKTAATGAANAGAEGENLLNNSVASQESVMPKVEAPKVRSKSFSISRSAGL